MGKINQPSNLVDRILRLEREIAEIRKRAGLGNAQISSGNLTVKGGTVVVRDDDDNRIAEVGAFEMAGEERTGLVVRRPDESVSLLAYANEDGEGFFSVWDAEGSIVMSTDAVSGEGLATPYIPYNVTPSRYYLTVDGESTSSTSFESQWMFQGFKQHPRIHVQMQVFTESTCTGEVRLRDGFSGTVLAGPIATGANTNVAIELVGTIAQSHLTTVRVEVDARRASGTGNIWTAVNWVYGVQS